MKGGIYGAQMNACVRLHKLLLTCNSRFSRVSSIAADIVCSDSRVSSFAADIVCSGLSAELEGRPEFAFWVFGSVAGVDHVFSYPGVSYAQDVVRVVVEGDGDVLVQEHHLTGVVGSLGEEEEGSFGEHEEDGSDEEAVEEQVHDMAETEIAINGLEDLGGVNFKELCVNDILRYHFPDRGVGYLFYSWYARMHEFAVDNCWHVKSVCDDHNHVLVGDNLIGLAPAHRKMNEADITQLNCYRMSGINTPKAYGVFSNQMGGYQNKKDKVCDARGVIGFLRKLKEKDPDLFWKHTYNEDRRLDKLFWSDGCSRDNYSLFGDVLTFDATYKNNKYKRPLVIFSGVNHHNQTIIFAVDLVSNEQEDTYVWLLQNLLDAMHRKFLVSVITNGDPTMKKAIRKVLPNAHHRLCAWHLLRNAVSNVAEPKFIKMLTRCMLWDLEVAEF
ncbi:protein FAR1-RELATED SEQUENCE 5-like [Lotus japonicus]|uniref:protein FAR1-RELATED SEQUENCE 5-like n=1 Tax=Lotus japonicus TaxID=34305 RepID=UPI002587ACCC|nr:protein FAR1-RELATED SEQUENCE 5-like [Lotus japonicus]